jgi:hypothetical protein
MHTKPEGVGLESPLEYIAQSMRGQASPPAPAASGWPHKEAAPPNNATALVGTYVDGAAGAAGAAGADSIIWRQ